MGIDVDNSLLVGAYYKDLKEHVNRLEEDGHDSSDFLNEEYCCASPYYDACIEDCFFGFEIENCTLLTEKWWSDVKEAAKLFEESTGVKARLRGGCHVW